MGWDDRVLELLTKASWAIIARRRIVSCKRLFTSLASVGVYHQQQLFCKADDLAVCILRASVAIA